MSILYTADTDFAPSRLPEHYTPPRKQTLAERIVLAICCLSLFAAFGIVFAVGLSS
jgi:hypothetical protein